MPTDFAVIVDLDFVESGPERHNRAGIGDVISNVSALADWELARRVRGEPVDGLAASLARAGAEAVINHPGDMGDDDFVTVLAEGLISSGLAMAVRHRTAPAAAVQFHPESILSLGGEVGHRIVRNVLRALLAERAQVAAE